MKPGYEPLDAASLFGRRVVDAAGHRLGRVTAIIHRADGCDVLVERRRLLRAAVRRVALDDLVPRDSASCWYRPGRGESSRDPGDDRVA